MSDTLQLRSSEILGLGTGLRYELAGAKLGSFSPTRILNERTGRALSTSQWYALLQPHYDAMTHPIAVTRYIQAMSSPASIDDSQP